MGHIFRPGLHACDVGGSLVLLDVVADRYFALGEVAGRVCLSLAAGVPIASADLAVVDHLVARDILRAVDQDQRPGLCRATRLVRVCAGEPSSAAGSQAVLSALTRRAWAEVELKVRPLAAILTGIASAKRRLPRAAGRDADPTPLAAAFRSADRVMTALDRCLPRSIALTRAMIARGLAPELVLGVKLRPFEAHCWVQHGDTLVSDDLGAIAPFTPILML